ncbi:MAG: Gx transporter family protein [Eubacterium sp.]|nr:Gx transporter family protein [Eubacterium sp.]
MIEQNRKKPDSAGGIAGRTAALGLFTAAAILTGYIEYLIPVNIGIPGIKLGLANFVIMIVLYQYGAKEAFLVSLIRVAVIGFLFGNLFSIFYGTLGAALSLAVMTFLRTSGRFTILGVSAAGGTSHNIGQLLAALIVTPALPLLWYLPILCLAGCGTGVLIGILTGEVMKRIPALHEKRIS